VELSFTNARVEMSRQNSLCQVGRFDLAGYQVQVLGFPGWLVVYEDLSYETHQAEIARSLEALVSAYLKDESLSHGLARLSGEFMMLLGREGRLERIVTSDQLPNSVYWYAEGDQVVVTDDVWRDISRFDPMAPDSYDQRNLKYLSRKKTCIPGYTYLKGLHRFQPATIYVMEQGALKRAQAVYPKKMHDRELGYQDFLSVIGRRLEPGPYTLAYSSGIDSHHLVETFEDRIAEVFNIYFHPPFQDAERSKEAATSVINCANLGRKLTHVAVDFEAPENLAWMRHAAERDPFACHYNFSMYHFFKQAGTDRIMTGQNADTVQWFGLTSDIPFGLAFLVSKLPNYKSDWIRLYYRWCVLRSYDRMVGSGLLNRRFFYGVWPEVRHLVDRDGYWPFMYFKMINNMTSGNTQLFRNAAAYFNKKVFFPYIEPLVLYASCYWRRPLTTLRRPKAALRALHPKCMHYKEIPRKVPQGLDLSHTPAFKQIAGDMAELNPELKTVFDDAANNPQARAFLYLFALRAGGSGPAEAGG
jgi:hypothetical protein